MTTSLNEGPAQIYQFPPGGRAALGGRRYGDTKPTQDTAVSNASACSGSWYHAAAIEDSKATSKPTSKPPFKPTWER
jgi:hypothetical protein